METQITKGAVSKSETFRTALILGGIIVAMLVSPFLLRDADVQTHFSILPPISTATKQIAHDVSSLSVDVIKTMVVTLFN